MASHPDNDFWIVDAGDEVITKRAAGHELSALDRLIYCLWVADYGIRNAGDLKTAEELYPLFQREAADLAGQLGFELTRESFSLARRAFREQYYDRFDRICDEIRGA